MPFESKNELGKTSGGGRKGYKYEQKQLKEMGDILNEVLRLGKKIAKSKTGIPKPTKEKFDTLMKLALKIMDKIHANQQHITGDISGEIAQVIVTKEELEDYIKAREAREKKK